MTADPIALAVFGAIVLIVAAAGIKVGMLLAPRIDRLTEHNDEEQGVDDD